MADPAVPQQSFAQKGSPMTEPHTAAPKARSSQVSDLTLIVRPAGQPTKNRRLTDDPEPISLALNVM